MCLSCVFVYNFCETLRYLSMDIWSYMWQHNTATLKYGITAFDNAVLPGHISIIQMPALHDGPNINVSVWVAKRERDIAFTCQK